MLYRKDKDPSAGGVAQRRESSLRRAPTTNNSAPLKQSENRREQDESGLGASRSLSIQISLPPNYKTRDSIGGNGGVSHRQSTDEHHTPSPYARPATLVESFMRIVDNVRMIQIQDIDEFPEPLDSEYARACAEIFEYLGEAHAPLPPGKLQILRGQIENDGSPTPCIRIIHRDFGNKQKMINFHLRFSRQRKRYDPPFTICYQNLSNLSSIGDSVSMTWTSREESLCGRLIETGAGKRQVRSTIGGLLEVGAKLYALTAYHSQDGEFGESSVPSTQDILEGLIDRGDFNYDIDPPTAVARYEGQTEFQEESVESTEKSKIDFSAAAGSILSTGSDWALVELDHDSMKLPNWLWFDVNQDTKDPDAKQPASSVVPRYLTSVMPPATSTQVQTVIVIAGVSGMVTATISRKLSQMRLDSGILVNVWTLSFDSFKGQGLKKGDSGSWVVEPQSGAVYGHVIASSHLNAFVLPLQTIMDEIDTEQCYLPTPFACFANLARNYRKSNNTDSAEEFAARAMADDVLEASTSNEFAQLIRARGSHPFTPAQTYSDLQPFTVFQYLVEKAGCRLPPYEEVVAWFTSEHTPFWYVTMEDVHQLLHDLGLSLKQPPTGEPYSWKNLYATGHCFLDYSRMRFSSRHQYVRCLREEERSEIARELDWISTVRKNVLSQEDVFQRRILRNTSDAIDAWRHQTNLESQKGFAGLKNRSVTKTSFPDDAFQNGPSQSLPTEPQCRILEFPVHSRYSVAQRPPGPPTYKEVSFLDRDTPLESTLNVNHIHISENNVEWMNFVLEKLRADIRCQGHKKSWESLQKGQILSRHMRSICALIETWSPFPDLMIAMPFLDWELPSRRERVTSHVFSTIQKRQEAVFGQRKEHSSPHNPSKLGRRKGDFTPTALGRVLLDAAFLYEKMALHADLQVISKSLFSSQPIHLRRTIQQACASPQVDLHERSANEQHCRKDFRASPIIVGQLWMRITRGNTIVTSFPKGYGRDLADPSSIYMSIRRKLADRATHIAIEPYDIALVIIDECIGAFFQRPESPAAELKAVPHGISALTQDVATIADKTWILREAHRTLLPSRSAVASSDILLQLLNLRLDIEELIQDLSMVAQVLAEQSTCVDDFIKMGALVAKGIQHDRLLSPDWIEPQLIKSRINSHKYEVKSLADTASGVHRTIVSLLQHVHLKTLLKEGTDFTRK